ncbi:MAG: RraA family protein [Halodesulfurarchaeum sp.]
MGIHETLDDLEKFDTPSISNVVATYPDDPLCLGLYNPWRENWYTDTTIHSLYPELGPKAGVAVTCVYGMPDPAFDELSFPDVVDAIDDQEPPVILTLEQDYPSHLETSVGLPGGLMTAAMKSMGAIGCVTDGPARDVEEIRSMEFQYLATGLSPGHGDLSVQAVNVPVSIGGMDVAPGEIIHMDANGAVKFPADRADDVLENVRKLIDREETAQERLEQADTPADVRRAFPGEEYDGDS